MTNRYITIICCVTAGLISTTSIADENSGNILNSEEIIITGEVEGYKTVRSAGLKTNALLLDTPQTVSAFNQQQIQDQAIQDIEDITRYTPGVTISQGEGHRDAIVIRGQRTTGDFFVDGIRDDVQYYRPLYNLERVEVHKGPNALIFGRGSGAGNINRVTKTPILNDRFTNIGGSGNTFGAYQFTVDGNTYVNKDIAVRFNGLAEGFENHRDFFDGERYAINPTIAAIISNKTRVQFSYEYIDDDRVVDRGIPSTAGTVAGTRANPVGPVNGFEDTFFGSPGANNTTLQAHIIRGRLFHDFNENHSVNLTLQYADYDKAYANLFPVASDLANNSVTLDGYEDTTDRENAIAQLNFLSDVMTGNIEHELLYGFEFGHQKTANARKNAFFPTGNVGDSSQDTFAFSDPLNIAAFSFPVRNRDRSSEATFTSIFFQDQITVTEQFQVLAGVRVDRFDIDVIDQIEINDGAADGNNGFLGRVDTEISPRLGFIYKPVEDISFYTSFSQSFLPRSGDQFLTLSPTTASLQPEEFTNYEFGVKWDLFDSLSFTSSVFRLNRESGTTVDPTNPLNTILISSKTEGLELQLVGNVLADWQINAGYSYLHGKEKGRVVGGASDNRTLREVPEHNFSIWNRYDFTSKFAMGLGLIHQSEQFTSNGNTVELPSFVRVDTAAYYTVNKNLRLQLNIENLFDEEYFPASHNDNNISTGEPINARLSVNMSF